MSWAEIRKAVNSDPTTPLNKLIERVLDKLDDIPTGGSKGKPFYIKELDNLDITNQSVSTLPYSFEGCAVVYNNEIHILGGSDDSTKHYKWNGTNWTEVSTLPYDFNYGFAVVYDNEIHILGSNNDTYYKYHYKWDGTSWTSVSTLPYNFCGYGGSAVVYNNEIHILGSNYSVSGSYPYAKYHYKWNGTSWTKVSTLPYDFYNGSVVIYNNEIHILGGGNLNTTTYSEYHYKWNGTSWTKVSKLPYDFMMSSAVVYNNEIHILGTGYSYMSTDMHYKWSGTSWTKFKLPCDFEGGAVVYNNEIHILDGTGHYKLILEYLYYIYLQSGSSINFYDDRRLTITEKTNCTKQSDNSLLVNSDGIVEFEVTTSTSEGGLDDIKYTIC